eukprot:1620078-Pyramimonas_sp.AAC.1
MAVWSPSNRCRGFLASAPTSEQTPLGAVTDQWLALVDEGRFEEFVEDMLLKHYDPGYIAANRKNFNQGADGEMAGRPAAADGDSLEYPNDGTNVLWVK